MMRLQIKHGQMWLGDCLELMRDIPSGSVDMILCDLPYGTTQNKWDTVIPFAPLWSEYWRICKGAIVLTAAQPFTSALVMSCPERFKYEWIWSKPRATGHLNAKKQPMKAHENVLVFYREQCTYNPQMTEGKPYSQKSGKGSTNYGDQVQVVTENNGERYPLSVQPFTNARGTIHPTQKPVALFEYLIRTYTNEGDMILDNCIGSGTTAIAAENTGRKWLGIERDFNYYIKAVERVLA